MSEQVGIIAVVAIVCLSLITCRLGEIWRDVEQEKVQLEREKFGLARKP